MKILKLILKNKFFGFILGIFISLFFIKLFIYKKKNNLKIIVFSEHRWRDSLKIINKDKNICLIKIPDFIYNRINSLFFTKMKE